MVAVFNDLGKRIKHILKKRIKYLYYIPRYPVNIMLLIIAGGALIKIYSNTIDINHSSVPYNKLYDFLSILIGTYAGFIPVEITYTLKKELKYLYYMFRYLVNVILLIIVGGALIKICSNTIDINHSFVPYNELYIFSSTLVGTYAGFIPLMMPYFYFIIREQKSIAISSIKKTIYYIEYFLIVIAIIILPWYLKNMFFQVEMLNDNGWIYGYISIMILLFVWTLTVLYRILNFTIPDILFERLIYAYDVYEYYLIERRKTGNFLINRAYKKIFPTIEGIYQLLFAALKNDLTKDFNEMFFLVKDRLEKLFIEQHKAVFLFKKDPNTYKKFYNDILKNQELLIIKLYESNHTTDAHEALYLLENLLPDASVELDDKKPENDNIKNYAELINIYMKVICELGLSLYLKGVIMTPLMSLLSHVMVKKEFLKLYIYIFRVWIIKAIENNDVKQEVLLSYSMMELVEKADFGKHENMLDAKFKKMAKAIGENGVIGDKTECEKNKYIGMSIFVLLNATVKCIELSQYECVGFMVKFIVSNFPEAVTNDCFYRLHQKNGHDEKFENDDTYRVISGISSFNINYKTYEYCLQKLVLLLYCQQKYMLDNKIVIGHKLGDKIDLKKYIGENPKYIYEKIVSAKDKYGMICLKDEMFLRRIKRDIFDLLTKDK